MKDDRHGKVYETAKTDMQRRVVTDAMNKFNGNQVKASEWLGLNRGTFRTLLKKFGYRRLDGGIYVIDLPMPDKSDIPLYVTQSTDDGFID